MPADVVLVAGSNPDSPALAAATAEGVETVTFDDRAADFGPSLLSELTARRIDLVCLAGYLRLLPLELLEAFPSRVLNIHPALLPKFGGKGMYGHHVHEAVLAAGESESGCTIHYVSELYDEGAAILQLRCSVLLGDTADTLAARVLALEHQAYPMAITKVWTELPNGD